MDLRCDLWGSWLLLPPLGYDKRIQESAEGEAIIVDDGVEEEAGEGSGCFEEVGVVDKEIGRVVRCEPGGRMVR